MCLGMIAVVFIAALLLVLCSSQFGKQMHDINRLVAVGEFLPGTAHGTDMSLMVLDVGTNVHCRDVFADQFVNGSGPYIMQFVEWVGSVCCCSSAIVWQQHLVPFW